LDDPRGSYSLQKVNDNVVLVFLLCLFICLSLLSYQVGSLDSRYQHMVFVVVKPFLVFIPSWQSWLKMSTYGFHCSWAFFSMRSCIFTNFSVSLYVQNIYSYWNTFYFQEIRKRIVHEITSTLHWEWMTKFWWVHNYNERKWMGRIWYKRIR
jgi:hypothetical protein